MAQLSVNKLEDDILHRFNNGSYSLLFSIDKDWYATFLDYCIDNQIDRKDCRKAIGNGCNVLDNVSFMRSNQRGDTIEHCNFLVTLVTKYYSDNEHLRSNILKDEKVLIKINYNEFKQYVRWRRISDLI